MRILYTYYGNLITRVDDATTATSYTGGTNFVNGANTNNEYVYDANGNITKDLNKGISNIQYNSLNLPSVVTFSDGSTITYTYTHDGKKLRTVHVIGGVTTTTDYCGNVIYENGTPKRLLTDEGYVDLTTNTYYYYMKDHQGNNRAVVNSSGTVQETNHYYPFGGLFATNGSVQPYKYNGKELDTKKGLNLYDYGARHYDAALGRWHVVDPMGEKYYSTSSYGYCSNSPLIHIDPTGMDEWELDIYGNIVKHIATNKHDAFYFLDENGKRIDGAFVLLDYGTVERVKTGYYSLGRNSTGELVSGYFDSYQVRGDDNANTLFEFLSQGTSDTMVEWSHIKAGIEGDKGLNYITTSHTQQYEAGMPFMWSTQLYNGYTLREMNHSHPSSSDESAADIKFKEGITTYKINNKHYPIPVFKIYHVPTKKYINY